MEAEPGTAQAGGQEQLVVVTGTATGFSLEAALANAFGQLPPGNVPQSGTVVEIEAGTGGVVGPHLTVRLLVRLSPPGA
jgi:hypothetical protein